MIRRAVLAGGAALALASGLGLARARQNERAAERSHPPLGDFVAPGGVPVHFVEMGPADAPPLVLLHGAGGNLRDFTFSLAPRLAARFRVIAFDRPGHGYTGRLHRRGESPAEQAALLADALAMLGVSRAIIGGFSYGGAVALAWALERPASAAGLLLMNAVSNPWEKPPSRLYDLAAGRLTGPVFNTALAAFPPRGLVEETLTGLFAPHPVPEGYADYIGIGLSLRRSQLEANGRQVTGLLPHIRAQSARYPGLTLPIEIVHGAEDRSVPVQTHPDQFVRQVPHARYTLVPGLGHSAHHYAQPEVEAALERLAAAAF